MKKILHVCLANFYIDNYSYQENILPKEHKKLGYEVIIIASTETFVNNKKIGYVKPRQYFNEDGIKVVRLPYALFAPTFLMKKIRSYRGLSDQLNDFCPDVIFVHDVQFLDAFKISSYAIKNKNVEVYADCLAYFSNSARSFFSREILHKIFYKLCAQELDKVVKKFWGVLPSRVAFLKEVYSLPPHKIDLLLMGAEDKFMNLKSETELLNKFKMKFSIPVDKIVIVTGGKIDAFKTETIFLIEAIKKFSNKIELVIFGSVAQDVEDKFNIAMHNANNVHYIGWLSVEDSSYALASADIAIFPGRHSVLWEQCVAMGVPIVAKHWPAISHLDIGGNLVWLKDCSISEIEEVIDQCIKDDRLKELKRCALADGRLNFSYKSIAARSIDQKFE